MAETILFAERQIDGFANTQGYGVPSRGFNFGEDIEVFTLEPNAEYTVLWDGEAYKTIAQDVSAALGDGAYALGNAAAFDSSFSGNNEPFIIGWSTVGIVILVVDGSTETTHTVGIVQEIEQEEQPETQYGPNDAVILSYSQTPVVYEEIPKVWLTHPDSTEEAPKLVPFTYGEVVEGMEIDLDFSAGNDMKITAPDGYLVKEAKILKPENLKPDNIAKDVEIAGVTGTHEGGGSTADHTIAYMSIDGTEELYLKPIMHGDTAGDVIALGLMDEPVIENTSEKEYTFLGWSDSIGGEVKTSMFESVTENRTVYAVYKVITTLGTGECGEAVTWKLTDDGLLVISGDGPMADYAAIEEQPWYEYAANVQTVTIEEGVTSVGAYAFRQLSNLSAVDLPESLTTIGNHAFRACAALTSITIPNNVTTIGSYMCYQATSLKSVVIGNGVTYIGHYAFHTCTALTSVTMGNSVQTIYYRAFQACSVLKSIVIPASCTLIGDNAFYGTGLISAIIEYTNGWAYYTSETATNGYTLVPSYLKNTSTAATYLRSTYVGYWWKSTLV